ncbi:hypothetical protein T8K17_01695 [Thalassobaculum sp. OXR-137]|uniref:hypothetical protein n=1 Tax=Thalassobaculum sp. OXR-137 TaxID=3100173 RepID=UPI002AC8E262|nr:hypothetical protein [Thalassobaculum sp. OXR-137]WPZ34863.1 hypothetical protein T8K17_01695 [Thalassobaculum sp. OXR-137]
MAELDWIYDETRRLIQLTYTGPLTVDDMMRSRTVRRSLGLQPGTVRVLVDLRYADLSELTAAAFKSMETERVERMGGHADRAAGVFGRETDLGIAELWADYRNRSAPGCTRIFMSRREAMAWLFSNEWTPRDV